METVGVVVPIKKIWNRGGFQIVQRCQEKTFPVAQAATGCSMMPAGTSANSTEER